jgi:hypothetical protein
MLENTNPMLIFAILGVVVIIAVLVFFDPFGFKGQFTNTRERFDGLTELNKKIFEKSEPIATPNVADPMKPVPDIPSNSAQQLNTIIFPELTAITPTPNAPEQPVEQTPEQTPEQAPEQAPEQTPDQAPEQPSFTLPDMVATTEETAPVILPSPNLPAVATSQESTDTKSFELPPTILSDVAPKEPSIQVPTDMKEIETPSINQPSFELPSLINTNEQSIMPQSSVLSSLEEQNKPVNVNEIVAPNQMNTADLIKQQIAQPVITNINSVTTLPASENNVTGDIMGNGVLNQFSNSRILGAFPLN